MASFFTKTFSKHDDYMTPKYAWENIKQFIPKDKVIWEAFTGDGASGQYLKEITNCEVIHDGEDFFAGKKGDIIISNPPFSKSKEVMTKMVEYDMPFILIMPSSKINTQYFRNLFSKHEDKIQIIIPRKRIHFKKLIDGKPPEGWKDRCNFDCFYYCWKMNLPRDIIWLED
tara:strand:- start:18 stop:530 length:513 start_codon:yes stop_codon:yes gene_type:complete